MSLQSVGITIVRWSSRHAQLLYIKHKIFSHNFLLCRVRLGKSRTTLPRWTAKTEGWNDEAGQLWETTSTSTTTKRLMRTVWEKLRRLISNYTFDSVVFFPNLATFREVWVMLQWRQCHWKQCAFSWMVGNSVHVSSQHWGWILRGIVAVVLVEIWHFL